MKKRKVRGYSPSTRQYLAFTVAPYTRGCVKWPKVVSARNSFLDAHCAKLVAIGGVHGQIVEHRKAVAR